MADSLSQHFTESSNGSMQHVGVPRPNSSNSMAIIDNNATGLDLCELEGMLRTFASKLKYQFTKGLSETVFGISLLLATEHVLI